MRKQNKTQSGRSMIEILAVIAVIGILTIAGVKGYETAQHNIGLNKLSEMMNLAAMTLEPEHPIYESLRDESGLFGNEYLGKKTEATKMFADLYKIKYADYDFMFTGVHPEGGGLHLGGKLYFYISPLRAGSNGRERFVMAITLRDATVNNASDVQLLKEALKRAVDTIKTNPVLRNRLISLIPLTGFQYTLHNKTYAEFDAAVETFFQNNFIMVAQIYFHYK